MLIARKYEILKVWFCCVNVFHLWVVAHVGLEWSRNPIHWLTLCRHLYSSPISSTYYNHYFSSQHYFAQLDYYGFSQVIIIFAMGVDCVSDDNEDDNDSALMTKTFSVSKSELFTSTPRITTHTILTTHTTCTTLIWEGTRINKCFLVDATWWRPMYELPWFPRWWLKRPLEALPWYCAFGKPLFCTSGMEAWCLPDFSLVPDFLLKTKDKTKKIVTVTMKMGTMTTMTILLMMIMKMMMTTIMMMTTMTMMTWPPRSWEWNWNCCLSLNHLPPLSCSRGTEQCMYNHHHHHCHHCWWRLDWSKQQRLWIKVGKRVDLIWYDNDR